MMVEYSDVLSSSPVRTPKVQLLLNKLIPLSCQFDRRMLDPSKNNTVYSRAKDVP